MRTLAVMFLAVVVLAGVLILRAFDMQPEPLDVPVPDALTGDRAIDGEAVARRLGEAIRIQTITEVEGREPLDPQAFERFRTWIAETYPNAHETFILERINGDSLIYRWAGGDGSRKPVAFLAHQDVVPVEDGTVADWRYPPFAGTIADGAVWGRGAIDMKSTLIGLMEAAERLVVAGFEPDRDIYFFFGHDEETGGAKGVAAIVNHLKARGVHFAWTLDEGSVVVRGEDFGIGTDIALVSIGEKGFVTLALTARAEGGHSSMPPQQTAISRLARSIARLHDRQFPSQIGETTVPVLQVLAAEGGFLQRVMMANLWLFGPAVEYLLLDTPTTAAQIRTTTAATVIESGTAPNVLPQEARALVNFRIHPADSVDEVIERVRWLVSRDGVEVTIAGVSRGVEPSPLSSMEGPGFQAIREGIGEAVGPVYVVPALTVGGTDSKHLPGITDAAYRFGPMRLNSEQLRTIHGTNEHIAVSDLVTMVRFYEAVMRRAGAPVPKQQTD